MSTLLLLLRSGTNYTQSVTDNVGASDTASTVSAFGYSTSDDTGSSDASSTVSAHFMAVTDDVGSTDGIGFSAPTDTMGLTDSVLFSVGKIFSDNAGSLDASASSSGLSGFPSVDVETLTDSQAFVKNIVNSFFDLAGSSDSVAFAFAATVNDTMGMTDPFITPHIFNQAATEDTGLTDLFSFTLNAVRAITITDDAGVNDQALPAGAHFFSITDLVAETDSNSTSFDRVLSMTDSSGMSDNAATLYTPPTAWTQSVTDVVGMTDGSSAASNFVVSLTDLSGTTDNTALLYLKTWLVSVDDGMSLADDSALVNDFHVEIDDNIGLDTVVSRSQNRVNSGRTIQMVEYVQRMQD